MRRIYALLIGLGLLIIASSLRAQLQVAVITPTLMGTRVVFSDTLSSDGRTQCDKNGQPEIWIRKKYYGTLGFTSLLAHERQHVRQMDAGGGCEAFTAKFRQDSLFRFDAELEAFAVQTAYEVGMGWTTLEHREDAVIGLLLVFYNPPYSAEEVARRVRSSRR